MKAPITAAQAMLHPTVVETINTLSQLADKLRVERGALLDRLEKADALVKAIKTDRHDWEDWPDDSREAFRAMEASK